MFQAQSLGYKYEYSPNPKAILGKICKQIITLKYEECCDRGMCVLQRYMKEGMSSSAHMVRESVEEVTF